MMIVVIYILLVSFCIGSSSPRKTHREDQDYSFDNTGGGKKAKTIQETSSLLIRSATMPDSVFAMYRPTAVEPVTHASAHGQDDQEEGGLFF